MLEDFTLDFAEYRPNQEAHGAALFALESYFGDRLARLESGETADPHSIAG
jgi:hypothetical protein